ncbi:MAG TPA: 50S ribosomal protein L19 [Phycisphaerales bacterium]|nr:50S ribosomal protein L19 [Phycisphaerales bacterium]|tara:strand:- start:166339 stop:166782 length:444 start_codon:yes stop_codon:yes gene_type:complete
MSQSIIEQLEQSQIRTDLPTLNVGDTVDVHYRIIEGNKERIQVFNGVVIKKENRGLNSNVTVRRIVANEGVERIFPLNSPKISNIEIKRHGDARRSKLYFLRDRVGKSRRLRDRRRGMQHATVVIGSQKAAKAAALAQAAAAAEASE